MFPRLSPHYCKIAASLVASAVFAPALYAQQDGPPVDATKMLNDLHALRNTQNTQIKAQKLTTIQQVNQAAGSASQAVALWEEAVRITEFEGAGHESTQFQAWKAGDGEAFKNSLVQNAVQLYFKWLSLTLQRSAGAKVKDMLPAVINYTKELSMDRAGIEALEDAMKREKDMNAGKAPARGPKPKGAGGIDPAIKKTHDGILKRPLGGSVYVQWMKLGDWVDVEKWEGTPGSFDGIYKNIILPEMRDQKDPRLLDYWDLKMKMSADEASRSKLAFDADKFNSLEMPGLLWSKYSDMVILGQKNKAVALMFTLIQKYPAHPDTADWVAQLEGLLAPTPPAPVSAATPPAAVAPGAPPVAGAPLAR